MSYNNTNFTQSLDQDEAPKRGSILGMGRDKLFSGPEPDFSAPPSKAKPAAPKSDSTSGMGGAYAPPDPNRKLPNWYQNKSQTRREQQAPEAPPKVDRLEEAVKAYHAKPGPYTLNLAVQAASPHIEKAVIGFGGGEGALMRSRGQILAAQAIKSYNPDSGAKSSSWIMTNLQGLQRYRNNLTPIGTPERVTLDAIHINRSREELKDELGRDPSDDELAQHSGFSVKRVKHVQKFSNPVKAESELTETSGEDEGATYLPGVHQDSPENIWAELVYHDMDQTNKQIYDRLLGRNGHQKQQPGDIAKALKLSVSAVSQRAGKIAQRLEEGSYSGENDGVR